MTDQITPIHEYATRAGHGLGHFDLCPRRPEIDLAGRIAADVGKCTAEEARRLTLARMSAEIRRRTP